MKITIVPRPLGQGRVAVSTLNEADEPVEMAFVGSWKQALKERNRRCMRWSGEADIVLAEAMPIQF